MKYYSRSHQWAEVEDGSARIGITEYALNELGEVTYVEPPESGKVFSAGECLAYVESAKTSAEVLTPVGGTVAEVNPQCLDYINDFPECGGWICRLTDLAKLPQDLLTEAEYREYCKGL